MGKPNKSPFTKVRATKDFFVGPTRMKILAIRCGSIREVVLSKNNNFWAKTEDGSFFGTCNLDDGWEIIKRK